jgi:membrane protease YdiL (CAAX protease family)
MNLKEKRKERLSILLFVLISYGYLWLLFGIGLLFHIPFSTNPRELSGLLFLAGVPASLVAAIIVTLITGEKETLYRLFKNSLKWQFSPIWYFAAVLIPFLVTLISTLTAINFRGDEVPEKLFSTSFSSSFLVFFLIYDGLREEVGWRDLMLPKLQDILGSLWGSISVGLLWAFWHLPLFFMPGTSQYGSSLIVYVYILTCWSVVISLLMNKAQGSVLVAILFHETVISSRFQFVILDHHMYFCSGE